MMGNRGGRWHPYNETPSRDDTRRALNATWLSFAIIACGLGKIAPDSYAGPIVLFAIAVSLVLVLPNAMRGSLLRGLWVDDEGVEEVYLPARRVCYRWRQLTGIQGGENQVTLTFGGRSLRLGPPVSNWGQIAERADSRLNGDELGNQEPDVPLERVAQWLRVPITGHLPCHSAYHRWHKWPERAFLLLYPLVFVAAERALVAALPFTSDPSTPRAVVVGQIVALLMGLLGLPLGMVALVVAAIRRRAYHLHPERRIHQIDATPSAIEARSDVGWHAHGWGSLRGIEQRGRFTVVSTTDGDLWLTPDLTHRDRLLDAIRSAIDAHAEGLVLPRPVGHVPETALSPAELSQVGADRGVSRVGP